MRSKECCKYNYHLNWQPAKNELTWGYMDYHCEYIMKQPLFIWRLKEKYALTKAILNNNKKYSFLKLSPSLTCTFYYLKKPVLLSRYTLFEYIYIYVKCTEYIGTIQLFPTKSFFLWTWAHLSPLSWYSSHLGWRRGVGLLSRKDPGVYTLKLPQGVSAHL